MNNGDSSHSDSSILMQLLDEIRAKGWVVDHSEHVGAFYLVFGTCELTKGMNIIHVEVMRSLIFHPCMFI